MAKVYAYTKDFLDKRHDSSLKQVGVLELPNAATGERTLRITNIYHNGSETSVDIKLGGSAALDPKYTQRLDTIENTLKKVTADESPFEIGGRYYSIVSYTWPDYYLDQDDKAETVSKWNRFLSFGKALGIGILNRNSGNWDTFDNDFKVQGEIAKNKGVKRLVFYVKTQYGAASGIDFEGKTDIPNWSRYTKEYILGQIDKFVTQYGSLAEGVFLDEVINGWGTQSNRIDWYGDLVSAIKEQYGEQFFVVCNCGANIAPALLKWKTDVFMSYEGTAENYLKENPGSPIHTADMAKEPGIRFWHVVHGVTASNYRQVFAKAAELGIGHVYVTDGVLDESGPGGQWDPVGNPYENPPSKQLEALIIPWINDYLPVYDEMLTLKDEVAKLKSSASTLKTIPIVPENGLKNSSIIISSTGLNVATVTITVPNNAARYGVVTVPVGVKPPTSDLDFIMSGFDGSGNFKSTMLRFNNRGQLQYMYDPPKGATLTGQVVWFRP